MALNAHELWAIPEQSFGTADQDAITVVALDRHIESADIPCSFAKSVSAWASPSWVTSS